MNKNTEWTVSIRSHLRYIGITLLMVFAMSWFVETFVGFGDPDNSKWPVMAMVFVPFVFMFFGSSYYFERSNAKRYNEQAKMAVCRDAEVASRLAAELDKRYRPVFSVEDNVVYAKFLNDNEANAIKNYATGFLNALV